MHYIVVKTFNSTCFIVFSAVLPRKCDWKDTKEIVFEFNRRLKKFCDSKKCGYMPTYTSFSVKTGPSKGDPMPGLWAVRDGGLHLNFQGRYLFTERFKSALNPKELGEMARKVNFVHWH